MMNVLGLSWLTSGWRGLHGGGGGKRENYRKQHGEPFALCPAPISVPGKAGKRGIRNGPGRDGAGAGSEDAIVTQLSENTFV